MCVIVTKASLIFIYVCIEKLCNDCRFYISSDISFNHSKTNMSNKPIIILHVFHNNLNVFSYLIHLHTIKLYSVFTIY